MSNTKVLYQNSETYLKGLLKNQLPTGNKFFLFGSRANGSAGFASDIDIGIWPQEPLNDTILLKLQEIIEDSFVPYQVDLVDFSKVSEQFKLQALKKIIPWN
ncbi:MAG: nucleotidyltransferase domain-containing protein [Pseudomonadota bacterium]